MGFWNAPGGGEWSGDQADRSYKGARLQGVKSTKLVNLGMGGLWRGPIKPFVSGSSTCILVARGYDVRSTEYT